MGEVLGTFFDAAGSRRTELTARTLAIEIEAMKRRKTIHRGAGARRTIARSWRALSARLITDERTAKNS